MRRWGLDLGLAQGLAVARALRDVPLPPVARRAADLATLLAGIAVVLAVVRAGPTPLGMGAAAAAAAAGALLGLRVRHAVLVLLLLGWVSGIAYGYLSR
jgi:hypothetical protein